LKGKEKISMAKLRESAEVSLTSLEKKMLSCLTLPMTEECPTALRYALAKYDADAVAEAYDRLYALWQRGDIEA
jgi:hypothetical protein